ncbi:MAG TPA: benzoate-CoA ligase family protein [Ktedonobacteraceae bacterium]|nr:benzoate-CoA ligase family protein [Ktedonobacteraceae bacterium]
MSLQSPIVIPPLPEQFNATTAFLDRHLVEGRGAKTAIYYEGKTFSYQEIAELANRVGNGLLSLDVEIEQRVALLLLDTPEFASVFFGTIKIGAVSVPLNTMLRPADYVYLLNDCRAKVLFVHATLWKALQPILSQLSYLRHMVVIGLEESGEQETAIVHDFARWTGRSSAQLGAAQTSKDDSAFWLYTSGSTGTPKGCIHLQHDMTYCSETFARFVLDIREDDITFSASKLFFAFGLGNNLYYPFSVGASAVYYPERPLAENLFNLVERTRPTLFFGAPTLYASMLALPEAEKRFDFSSVRLCISAGEGLPADLLRRFEQRFQVPILDGLGCTEMLQTFISNRVGDVRPGSSGKLVPGYTARIVDELGQNVPVGEMGSLLVSGDSAAVGYWNKHNKTKEVFRGEWVATGDKYYQDTEGYFWYCGRTDDMLKVSGQWVSPFEVEAALIAHPAVLEAAVVGALDQYGLVKPKAYVVLQQGYEPSEALVEELQRDVKERLVPYKYPRWIEFITELPKTATGKIQRFLLKDAEMSTEGKSE